LCIDVKSPNRAPLDDLDVESMIGVTVEAPTP
jgi:hypothetical protein